MSSPFVSVFLFFVPLNEPFQKNTLKPLTIDIAFAVDALEGKYSRIFLYLLFDNQLLLHDKEYKIDSKG